MDNLAARLRQNSGHLEIRYRRRAYGDLNIEKQGNSKLQKDRVTPGGIGSTMHTLNSVSCKVVHRFAVQHKARRFPLTTWAGHTRPAPFSKDGLALFLFSTQAVNFTLHLGGSFVCFKRLFYPILRGYMVDVTFRVQLATQVWSYLYTDRPKPRVAIGFVVDDVGERYQSPAAGRAAKNNAALSHVLHNLQFSCSLTLTDCTLGPTLENVFYSDRWHCLFTLRHTFPKSPGRAVFFCMGATT